MLPTLNLQTKPEVIATAMSSVSEYKKFLQTANLMVPRYTLKVAIKANFHDPASIKKFLDVCDELGKETLDPKLLAAHLKFLRLAVRYYVAGKKYSSPVTETDINCIKEICRVATIDPQLFESIQSYTLKDALKEDSGDNDVSTPRIVFWTFLLYCRIDPNERNNFYQKDSSPMTMQNAAKIADFIRDSLISYRNKNGSGELKDSFIVTHFRQNMIKQLIYCLAFSNNQDDKELDILLDPGITKYLKGRFESAPDNKLAFVEILSHPFNALASRNFAKYQAVLGKLNSPMLTRLAWQNLSIRGIPDSAVNAFGKQIFKHIAELNDKDGFADVNEVFVYLQRLQECSTIASLHDEAQELTASVLQKQIKKFPTDFTTNIAQVLDNLMSSISQYESFEKRCGEDHLYKRFDVKPAEDYDHEFQQYIQIVATMVAKIPEQSRDQAMQHFPSNLAIDPESGSVMAKYSKSLIEYVEKVLINQTFQNIVDLQNWLQTYFNCLKVSANADTQLNMEKFNTVVNTFIDNNMHLFENATVFKTFPRYVLPVVNIRSIKYYGVPTNIEIYEAYSNVLLSHKNRAVQKYALMTTSVLYGSAKLMEKYIEATSNLSDLTEDEKKKVADVLYARLFSKIGYEEDNSNPNALTARRVWEYVVSYELIQKINALIAKFANPKVVSSCLDIVIQTSNIQERELILIRDLLQRVPINIGIVINFIASIAKRVENGNSFRVADLCKLLIDKLVADDISPTSAMINVIRDSGNEVLVELLNDNEKFSIKPCLTLIEHLNNGVASGVYTEADKSNALEIIGKALKNAERCLLSFEDLEDDEAVMVLLSHSPYTPSPDKPFPDKPYEWAVAIIKDKEFHSSYLDENDLIKKKMHPTAPPYGAIHDIEIKHPAAPSYGAIHVIEIGPLFDLREQYPAPAATSKPSFPLR